MKDLKPAGAWMTEGGASSFESARSLLAKLVSIFAREFRDYHMSAETRPALEKGSSYNSVERVLAEAVSWTDYLNVGSLWFLLVGFAIAVVARLVLDLCRVR
jgi:hypothetical protein